MTWLAVLCATAAVLLALPSSVPRPSRTPVWGGSGLAPLAAAGVGIGAWLLVGGVVGIVAGVAAAWGARRVLSRAETPTARHEREEVERTLPHLVELFAATLRAGAEPVAGLARVCQALPGPAADRLLPVVQRAHWGAGGVEAWSAVEGDDALAPLARAMVRSHVSGASVVQSVERLADELARESMARAEDAARKVGVSAAVPLGTCLLPAFMLLGVVPTVASLFGSVSP
ncbi:hypothetical protein F4692_001851 [Nocardioides cavernae]|uniref:Type II secretion system protein GspF domain-containing protein n=1 Tax=Nocardioides cavernae TaxID=1921566 RepID=A0A7Y9KTD5_9ACTN|nr:type II secretion system F family protein [Nocardioides cavernae]NYE36718.1 hypothetical protein [Nocardioides cavernae]